MSPSDSPLPPPVDVVIAEDSRIQAIRLRRLLEQSGCAVRWGADGRQALEHVQQRAPDVVIADIDMPEMNGYQLCEAIKADPELRRIPVILLSVLSDPEDIIRGLRAGADNYVTKPYNESYLLSRLRSVVETARVQREEPPGEEMEVFLAGQRYRVSAGRQQILNLLLSVFETAVANNRELVRVNSELERANLKLRALNQQKDEFLGMAAHDLRNPIAAIYGFSLHLLEEVAQKLDDEQTDLLTRIQNSSEYMLTILDDLLDMSAIDSGKLTLERCPVDIGEIIDRATALHRIFADPKGIELRSVVKRGLPPVDGDPARLEQVLNNLVSNAIKYSHANTRVVITARMHGDRVLVVVRDKGQGIPADDLPKLFKPFEKARVQSTAGERSTGLGLAIVKRIIDAHGGSIRVESQVGKGTAFHVELPVNREGAVAADGPEAALSAKRVLLVDDSDDVLLLARKQLEKMGAEVITAASGEEALNRLQDEKIDLVLLDVEMPGMDGYKTAIAIRAAEGGRAGELPILAVSAHTDEEHRRRCLEAGMQGICPKPLSRERLGRILRDLEAGLSPDAPDGQ